MLIADDLPELRSAGEGTERWGEGAGARAAFLPTDSAKDERLARQCTHLGADLVTALASLNVHNLAHFR